MVKALLAEQKPDPADAEAAYAEVLKLYPDFTPAQKQLALLYVRQTDHNDQAYALALKARKALPADPDLAKVLGMVLCRQGDFARASYLLLESVHQRPRDAELLYYLGLTEYHLKQRKDAKMYFQQALDSNLSGSQAADARQKLAELK
jgi:Tfp pilus assembly protein PilF